MSVPLACETLGLWRLPRGQWVASGPSLHGAPRGRCRTVLLVGGHRGQRAWLSVRAEGIGHLSHMPLSPLLRPALQLLIEYPWFFSYFWDTNTLLYLGISLQRMAHRAVSLVPETLLPLETCMFSILGKQIPCLSMYSCLNFLCVTC